MLLISLTSPRHSSKLDEPIGWSKRAWDVRPSTTTRINKEEKAIKTNCHPLSEATTSIRYIHALLNAHAQWRLAFTSGRGGWDLNIFRALRYSLSTHVCYLGCWRIQINKWIKHKKFIMNININIFNTLRLIFRLSIPTSHSLGSLLN